MSKKFINKREVLTAFLILIASAFSNGADLNGEAKIVAPPSPKYEGAETSAAPAAYSGAFYSDFIEAAYYETHDKREEAFKIYERLYENAKDDKAILSSLAELSVSLQDKNAIDKYVPAYYAAAPERVNAKALKAGWLWARGDLKGAAELYRSALSQEPDNPGIITKYVILLIALNSDQAIEYLKSLSAQYPATSSFLAANIADLYLKQGDIASAEKYLKDYVAENPYEFEPYTILASIYEVKGEPENALKIYLAMEKYGLASAEILVKAGAYYVLSGEKQTALEYFKKAKALDDGQPAAAQFLVLDAQARGDYESAFKFLSESSAYENDPSLHIRASYFLSKAGKKEQAAQVLAEAYSKFPEDGETAFYYALSLIDLKEYKKAGETLSSFLRNNPDNENALFHYAYVLERGKDYKAMERQLKKLLELNPDNAEVLNFYGYYLIDKTRRLDEGCGYVEKALAVKPEETAYIDSLAWCYYKKGEYEKSYSLLSAIPANDIETLQDAEIYLHLAQAAWALSLWEESSFYYNKVLEIDPNNKTALKGLKKAAKKLKLK